MQRHTTSLTALAVAGAMAIAITPNASAQSSDGSVSAEVSGSSVNAAVDTLTSPVLDPITEGMSLSLIHI